MYKKITNYSHQSIDKKDIQSVNKTLMSGILTQGNQIIKFENNLKKYFNAKYANAVSSGTAALHLVSNALSWDKNDLIITTPISFIATANSILYRNSKPIFVDINLNDYNIDLDKLESKLKKTNKNKKKIKAIIAVDYAGNPCDWPNLRYLAKKFSIKLINDNCHALGAKFNGRKDYAIKYADVVTQSFHPLKNITTGEGGAIITNDIAIHKKVKLLRNHGIESSKKKEYWNNEVNQIGYNYRLTDFQASLGISQLKKINFFIRKKQNIAKRYDKFFKNFEFIKIPPVREKCLHAYHLYPILIDFNKLKVSKSQMMKFFLKNNFRLQVHYKPIHTFNLYKKLFKYKNNDFPESIKFFQNEISIPIFPNFTQNNQTKFMDKFNNFFKR